MRVVVRHQGKVLAKDVMIANTFWTRLGGYGPPFSKTDKLVATGAITKSPRRTIT